MYIELTWNTVLSSNIMNNEYRHLPKSRVSDSLRYVERSGSETFDLGRWSIVYQIYFQSFHIAYSMSQISYIKQSPFDVIQVQLPQIDQGVNGLPQIYITNPSEIIKNLIPYI